MSALPPKADIDRSGEPGLKGGDGEDTKTAPLIHIGLFHQHAQNRYPQPQGTVDEGVEDGEQAAHEQKQVHELLGQADLVQGSRLARSSKKGEWKDLSFTLPRLSHRN